MDATAAGEEKALRPANGGGASRAAVSVAVPAADVGVVDASGGAAVEVVESGDDEEDEQVERFYALLANIRALRGMYRAGDGAGASSDDSGGSASGGRGRKRARAAEPPWRPAFRIEDFEEVVDDAARAGKEQAQEEEDGSGAKRPAVKATGAGEDKADVARGSARREVGSPRRGRRTDHVY
ncbi:hypothetical protein ACP70R_028432 [Stipagrostis hirtigluma subsp. patula]